MSEGWTKRTYGNYNFKTSDLMSPAVVDENYTFMVEFTPNQNANLTGHTFSMQISFLYTNERRERMLRVMNHTTKLGPLSAVLCGLDSDVLTEVLFKRSLQHFYSSTPLLDINSAMLSNAKKIYQQYHQHAGKKIEQQGYGNLDRFPFQMLGVMKHTIFCMQNISSYVVAVDIRNC
jgi:hypothetical protein